MAMMWGYGYGNGPAAWGWGAMLGMMVFGLLVLVGLILLIVWAVRAGEHRHGYAQHAPGQGVPPTHQQWGVTPEGTVTPEQRTGYPGAGMPQRDPALDAVRERYARGEITREQYEEIVRALGYEPRT